MAAFRSRTISEEPLLKMRCANDNQQYFKYVCITTNQPYTKSNPNPNPNPNPTTTQ